MKHRWMQAGLAFTLLLWTILHTQTVVPCVVDAMQRCAQVVFPSLFPFFVLSNLIVRSGALSPQRGSKLCRKLFGIPVAGLSACLMGFLGGYPLGVSTAAALHQSGTITKKETQRLLRFCNNTGPAFIFGMVGTALFPDKRICATLYATHILSALLTGRLLWILEGQSPSPIVLEAQPAAATSPDFPSAVRDAFFSALQICGFVIFFAVVLLVLLSIPMLQSLLQLCGRLAGLSPDAVTAVISGAIDLPSGMWALTGTMSQPVRLLLCGCVLSWGGLCVHMQAASVLRTHGLTVPGYYTGKLLHTALSALILLPVSRVFFGLLPPIRPVLVLTISGALLPVFQKIQKTGMVFPRKRLYNDIGTSH